VLVDDPSGLRLDGLPPGGPVDITAIVEVAGTVYRANASYRADAFGTVDTARDPSGDGTYRGVDPFGLLWSGMPEGPAHAAPGAPVLIHLHVEAGTDVFEADLERHWTAPDTIMGPVDDNGVVGVFARPSRPGPHPGIIVFGGSGGGLGPAAVWAPMLASHGFAALGIAYFGVPGLPANLQEIEVEVVARAAAWLDGRPEVDRGPLGVMGVSRGSELALLAGIHVDRIGPVVAACPSGVGWPALGPRGPIDAPAWTVEGKPVPYVFPRGGTPGEPSDDHPIALRPMFEHMLEDAEAVRRAEIPVERARGPLLLVSGEDDLMWPSTIFGDLITRRLERTKATVAFTHLRYPDAGHALIGPPGMPAPTEVPAHPLTGERYALGGSGVGNARARADSWPRIVAFLTAELSRR
jgi:dienelactone hydrolase